MQYLRETAHFPTKNHNAIGVSPQLFLKASQLYHTSYRKVMPYLRTFFAMTKRVRLFRFRHYRHFPDPTASFCSPTTSFPNPTATLTTCHLPSERQNARPYRRRGRCNKIIQGVSPTDFIEGLRHFFDLYLLQDIALEITRTDRSQHFSFPPSSEDCILPRQ